MSIQHTRALLNAALDGKLDQVRFVKDPIFGFEVPTDAPGVPSQVFEPARHLADKAAYDEKASTWPGSSSTISSSSRTRLPLKCWRRRPSRGRTPALFKGASIVREGSRD